MDEGTTKSIVDLTNEAIAETLTGFDAILELLPPETFIQAKIQQHREAFEDRIEDIKGAIDV